MASGVIDKPFDYDEFSNKFTDVAIDDADNVPIGIMSFQRYDRNSANTPYTEGLTGTASGGGIITFRSSLSFGGQIAFPSACEFLCVRTLGKIEAGKWTPWRKISPDS